MRIYMTLSMFFAFNLVFGQDMQTPYSDWVKSEFSSSYKSIVTLIESKYGTEDTKQNLYMMELQCNAFNNVLVFMNSDSADWSILEKSLVHGCSYKGTDRGDMDWWEWPQTDWIKVEYEYKLLLEKSNSEQKGQ